MENIGIHDFMVGDLVYSKPHTKILEITSDIISHWNNKTFECFFEPIKLTHAIMKAVGFSYCGDDYSDNYYCGKGFRFQVYPNDEVYIKLSISNTPINIEYLHQLQRLMGISNITLDVSKLL